MKRFLLLLPFICTCKQDPPGESSSSTTLEFSGYSWIVKNGKGLAPGPNN